MGESRMEHRKLLLNVQKLDSFLQEFSRYSEEQKIYCVRCVEDKCMEKLVHFVSFMIAFERKQ
ncbi:hypothetical protein [Petroclostridium sp. X23]|uniref:hypothetical protein n=1 Tax=Petroclostridium sp. X23 TaxID=3045146 RepID=UPI0024ADEB0A|nr:hypothetical protein [Petroclostridium sp. X23]WHH59697.1 hypothetical protein QKW49_02750 [Petroclostridium sp. X23]